MVRFYHAYNPGKYPDIGYLCLMLLIVILLSEGCCPERKLALKFVASHKGYSVMIEPLYELQKDNFAISYDTNVRYSPAQFDSIAWEQSCYIKQVSDSVFLTRFTSSLIDELTKEGFDVYVGESPGFFKNMPDPKWLVKVAQLQLDEIHSETIYEVTSEKIDGIYTEYASLRMNMISLLSWFEASRCDTGVRKVLYREESKMDNRTLGYDFILNKGNEGLQRNRDSLNMEDVYNLAGESGEKHAELLFDHFMNEYINSNLPPGINNRKYYFYDRKSLTLKQGINEWIEQVD